MFKVFFVIIFFYTLVYFTLNLIKSNYNINDNLINKSDSRNLASF